MRLQPGMPYMNTTPPHAPLSPTCFPKVYLAGELHLHCVVWCSPDSLRSPQFQMLNMTQILVLQEHKLRKKLSVSEDMLPARHSSNDTVQAGPLDDILGQVNELLHQVNDVLGY